MSREVLGGTALEPPADSLDLPEISPAPAPRPALRPSRRALAAAAMALSIAVGSLAGWGAWTAWDDVRALDTRAGQAKVAAVVVSTSSLVIEPARVTVDLTVHVRAAGTSPVVVRAPRDEEGTASGASFSRPRPGRTVLAPGERSTMVLTLEVPCFGSEPFRAPALVLGDEALGDGTTGRALPVDGALHAMVDACAAADRGRRPLVLRSALVYSSTLVVKLASPTSRVWPVTAVSAGGVELEALPAGPVRVDGAGKVLRLVGPDVRRRSCPASWQAAGIPQRLELTLDAGEPVQVVVPVGLPLSTWLLDQYCAPGGGGDLP